MLRESHQVSLDGGRSIRIRHNAIDAAASCFERFLEVGSCSVAAKYTAALHQSAKPSKAGGNIGRAAAGTFDSVNGQYRNRCIRAEPRRVSVH